MPPSPPEPRSWRPFSTASLIVKREPAAPIAGRAGQDRRPEINNTARPPARMLVRGPVAERSRMPMPGCATNNTIQRESEG